MLRGLLDAPGCEVGRQRAWGDAGCGRKGVGALFRHPRTTKPEAGPQNLPILAARDGDHAAEPGVGDGHHLHPDGARLRLSGRRARLVQPPRAVVAAVDHNGSGVLRRDAGGRSGASRQAGHLQHGPGLASSRARHSPACSPTTALRSAWTARAPGGTTCSSSGCGAASNTRRCTCGPTTASARPALRSAATWTSTTAADRTRALTARHPIKPTSTQLPLRLAA